MTGDSTTVQSVATAIDHLAAKLQVPAGQVWRTLQIQARIEFFQSVVWLFACVGFAVAVRLCWRAANRAVAARNAAQTSGFGRDEVIDHPEWVIPLGFASIIAIIALFVAFAELNDGLGYLLNPDYYALTKIAKVFK